MLHCPTLHNNTCQMLAQSHTLAIFDNALLSLATSPDVFANDIIDTHINKFFYPSILMPMEVRSDWFLLTRIPILYLQQNLKKGSQSKVVEQGIMFCRVRLKMGLLKK